MSVLANLEPQKVFSYFEEIAKIPHGSGNVEQISGYLVEFARKRNLQVIQDEMKNVILFKEASPGYEEEPPLILQGHMDMVAVKKPDYDIDMKTTGLKVGIDGDNLYAEGTSLGGDDGIAVAYALAALDSEELAHPRLEVVITVDEETGMDGARAIDLSMLKGHRLLNLDSEEEGIFLASCAGGARVKCRFPLRRERCEGTVCALSIGGLLGGHSGEEIHKGRGNSNMLFARVLWELCQNVPVRLIEVSGGLADNAIPRETDAKLLIPRDSAACESVLAKLERKIAEELAVRDPGFYLRRQFAENAAWEEAASAADTRRVAAALCAMPNGVQAMSADVEGLVETSLNLGILEADGEGLAAEFSVRSSVESAKDALIHKLCGIVELAGGDCEVSGSYPGWKYRADSPLREKMTRVYRRMYGVKPQVRAIHAGLECGLLGSKIADLDCVSIGPDMKNIHTTEETLSISSTRRVWEFLVEFLAEKDC